MKKINLDKKVVSENSNCYEIAEIRHKQQGKFEKCKQLFMEAKLAGADTVKLQKSDNKTVYTKSFYNSEYVNGSCYRKS